MKFTAKICVRTACSLLMLLLVITAIGSSYMLHYALSNSKSERVSAQQCIAIVKEDCPWTAEWIDSVYSHHAVTHIFHTMKSGERHHALIIKAPHPTPRTAIVIHGYRARAEFMLHIAYIYNRMGWDVLLPDLHAHGQSEGEQIGMGWNERNDILEWSAVAERLLTPVGESSEQVLHGISMGAATVMAVSGEPTPTRIKGFVEDCGYSSVREEFKHQLKEQFNLPPFPLLSTTSAICGVRNGWTFGEANQLRAVSRCSKPMLFIHGEADKFVPFSMLQPLYEAKRGKKQLFVAHGSGHGQSYADHPTEYASTIGNFVNSLDKSSDQ